MQNISCIKTKKTLAFNTLNSRCNKLAASTTTPIGSNQISIITFL